MARQWQAGGNQTSGNDGAVETEGGGEGEGEEVGEYEAIKLRETWSGSVELNEFSVYGLSLTSSKGN